MILTWFLAECHLPSRQEKDADSCALFVIFACYGNTKALGFESVIFVTSGCEGISSGHELSSHTGQLQRCARSKAWKLPTKRRAGITRSRRDSVLLVVLLVAGLVMAVLAATAVAAVSAAVWLPTQLWPKAEELNS